MNRRARVMAALLTIASFFAATAHVVAREVNLATTDETAFFDVAVSDYTVNVFVEQLDGQPVKFRARDTAIVDAGERTMAVRLEHQPASGSSILLGGLGNLLARAVTNKTFRTELTAELMAGHEYQFIAAAQGEEIVVVIYDHTEEEEVTGQKFVVRDGKFERIF